MNIMAAMYSQMAQKKITCTYADIIYFVLYTHMGRKDKEKDKAVWYSVNVWGS